MMEKEKRRRKRALLSGVSRTGWQRPRQPPLPLPAEPAAKSKKQPKKSAAKGSKKPSGPSVSELIVNAVSASKERSGVSLAALKKALSAGGYDVEKNNSRLKLAVRSLVTKGALLQVKGSGASGSFKLNKKQETKVAKKKSAAAAKPKKPTAAKKTAKSPKKPKKVPTAAKKSPKKTKKPAAAQKVAKSPKKPKAAPKPKKTTKSPAKKAAKPKAAKSPAKKTAKAKKPAAKK